MVVVVLQTIPHSGKVFNIKTTWINHVGLILHDLDLFNTRGPRS
jgi:hypothetical protein